MEKEKKTAIGVFAGVFTVVMSGFILHVIKSEQKKAQSRKYTCNKAAKL